MFKIEVSFLTTNTGGKMNDATLFIKKSRLKLVLFFPLLSLLFFSHNLKASRLTILHTNDHHGHYIQDPKQRVFGMAARKTIIDKLRGEAKGKGARARRLRAS